MLDTYEIAARWVEHFGNLEAGCSATPAQVIEACDSSIQGEWPTPPDLLELLSEAGLAKIIATAARHKTPGADGIPAEAGFCQP